MEVGSLVGIYLLALFLESFMYKYSLAFTTNSGTSTSMYSVLTNILVRVMFP